MLREEFLVPLGITQSELAKRMDVPVGRVNRLGLQTDWELWHARREVNLRDLEPISRKAD